MDRIRPNASSSSPRRRPLGFTLIELLVVISIIALLVGILLPALGAARRTAQNSQCLSNIRQMDTAAMSFAADHRFNIQISSTDTVWAPGPIPSELRGRQAMFADQTGGNKGRVKDWASAIVPYMGGSPNDDFENADTKVSQAFICPSDPNVDGNDPGYQIFNNISDPTGKQRKPVSYGINADATTYNNNGGTDGGLWAGAFNPLVPYKGDVTNGSLDEIRSTSNTLLYADCGTRSGIGGDIRIAGDQLFYTAAVNLPMNQDDDKIGTLASVYDANQPTFRYRIPVEVNNNAGLSASDPQPGAADRHGNKINVAFTDGHAAGFSPDNFSEVYLSPHK